jgi:hypothetical protein
MSLLSVLDLGGVVEVGILRQMAALVAQGPQQTLQAAEVLCPFPREFAIAGGVAFAFDQIQTGRCQGRCRII